MSKFLRISENAEDKVELGALQTSPVLLPEVLVFPSLPFTLQVYIICPFPGYLSPFTLSFSL
jgi:hypothetical protein